MKSLYPAFGHPKGIQAAPWYEIKGNDVYPAFGHPKGIQAAPWYTIRNNQIYPAFGHPKGIQAAPGMKSKGKMYIQHLVIQREYKLHLGIQSTNCNT